MAELVAESHTPCFRSGLHPLQDRARVWLLFVNLGSLQLAPNLGSGRFQIRLRYGGSGRFREKFSHKVTSTPVVEGQRGSPPQEGMLVELHSLVATPELNGCLAVCESWCQASGHWTVRLMSSESKAVLPENLSLAAQVFANVDAMLVFPWSVDLAPKLTFSLRKLGFYDTTISETTVTIPFAAGRPGVAQQELLLLGKRGASGFVGQLGVSAELRGFIRGDLLHRSPRRSPSPGALDDMLGALELLRMPPGHLGPNSMAGRPATGTPLGRSARQPGDDASWRWREGETPVVMGRPVPGGATSAPGAGWATREPPSH